MRKEIKEKKKTLMYSIAHGIANGMLADPAFDRFAYLHECIKVCRSFEIDERTIGEVTKLANKYGVMEYQMVKNGGGTLSKLLAEAGTGAQIHPMNTVIATNAEELSELLFDNLVL